MKWKIIGLILVGVIGFGITTYFLRDQEPFQTIYTYILPYWDQAFQVVKENVTLVLGSIGGISTAIISIIQRRATSSKEKLITVATDRISGLEGQVNTVSKELEEKVSVYTEKIVGLTGQRDKLQDVVVDTADDLKTMSSDLTSTNTLLSGANKRVEDLTKDNETLRKAIEFLKANPEDSYIKAV